MRAKRKAGRGTVVVGVVMLIVLVAIILSIIRNFWLSSANEHYDKLIKAYITQKSEYGEQDAGKLRKQLLGDSLFMRMHIWDKDKLVVDEELYKDMDREYRLLQRQKNRGPTLTESIINL